MDIYDPNQNFDFKKLSLTSPTVSSGGNYFIKFHMQDDNPLYIQPPKCTTKQGIVKINGGKKLYCDLVFSNTNESFIKWIEDLEKYSQEYIFNNREKWFESQLELEDIENSFAPSLKIYKSGKSYILRTIVPTLLGKCGLKIFNENETEFDINDFKETTNVITILEIQGIKCSSKSFQIDIEIKQMMVLKPSILFDKCLIKSASVDVVENQSELNIKHEDKKEDKLVDLTKYLGDTIPTKKITNASPFTSNLLTQNINDEIINIKTPTELSKTDVKNVNDELLEVEFDLENIEKDDDPINLKDRNEIYVNIYKEAVEKAKEARNLAIYSYLEAKRIKNLYLIEDKTE